MTNAANAAEVRHASRRERKRITDRRDRLRRIMQDPDVRAEMWELLADYKVFENIWHPSALIHFNAGVQNCGQQLLARLLEADEDAYDLMAREARARARRDAVETAAIQTPRAEGEHT